MRTLSNLEALEAESIHVLREAVAQSEHPVMLYSVGKDSSVMLHLARKAFYPSPPPFPLLHVDTTWKFREMYSFRDRMAAELGDGPARARQPRRAWRAASTRSTTARRCTRTCGRPRASSRPWTRTGSTWPSAAPAATRRRSRAKERVFSVRSRGHGWDPKRQRPELWRVYNAAVRPGETIRVFPLSNWTELDVWLYIHEQQIPVVPLYFAAERPIVERDEALHDGRRRALPARPRRAARAAPRALPDARLLPADRRGRERRRPRRWRSSRRCWPRARPSARGGSSTATRTARWSSRSSRGTSDGLDRTLGPAAPPRQPPRKDRLRFITCGSVDDGKSTLIGRLLYESETVFDDQLAALAADSKRSGTQNGDLDLALLLDGLKAEREQGITIDVAHRYFATERRAFIVIDAPGHEQYTRNMVTGASSADAAVVLVDARRGVTTQTLRHSHVLSLLGIDSVALAVNKLDLVGFDRAVFERIRDEYAASTAGLGFTTAAGDPGQRAARRQRHAAEREHAPSTAG